MNTDFAYRGKMMHEVPEPYIWEPSFMTFYKRLDDEHVKLFDCIRECSENPSDDAAFAQCKTLLRMHFDYEESEFCKVPDYDCYGHYLKHYNFQTKFQEAHTPLSAEVTDMAKNWLAQHIKNTDFAYRGKLTLHLVLKSLTWPRTGLHSISRTLTSHTEASSSFEDTMWFLILMFGMNLSLLTSSSLMMNMLDFLMLFVKWKPIVMINLSGTIWLNS